jgi:glycosyltransferase involved in cell wall biosynthesis
MQGLLMPGALPVALAFAESHPHAKPVLLHITHHWGGGTEQHVQEVVHTLADAAEHIVLHSRADGLVILTAPGEPDQVYHPHDNFRDLVDRLRGLAVTRVHVHQLFTVPIDVRRLIDELDLEFDFTVHDYHTLCPRVHLKTRDNAYCGEPDEAGCSSCLNDWHLPDERDIAEYRAHYAWVYQQARRVICPTRDVAARIERYRPHTSLVVAPHPRPVAVHPTVSVTRIAPSEPLRVAVLGWVTAFKGAARVLGSARVAANERLPLHIQVIGTIDGEAPGGLDVTGPYEANDLQQLLAHHRPHLLWYAAQVPETYSYTLSEGLEAGLPVMVPRLGAFPERVSGRPWSWIVDWNLTSGQAVAALMAAREHFVSGVPPAPPTHEVASRASIGGADFYRTGYLDGET